MGRLTEQTLACSRDQLLLQESNERRFANSHWSNDQHHGPQPVQTGPFSGRTNGLEDGIACLQQIRMFNGTFLFKPGYPRGFRLREKHRIKPLWSLVKLFVFFHQRSRLNTRRVSPSEVACRAVNFNGSLPSSGVGSSGAVEWRASDVPRPPSRTDRAAFVSRSWRGFRKITSFAAFFRRKSASCFCVISTCSFPYNRRFCWRNSVAKSLSSRSEQPAS